MPSREDHVFERQQARHLGLGDPDMSREVWLTNIQRDSYASIVGHTGALQGIAVNRGLPMCVVRAELIAKMANPDIAVTQAQIPQLPVE